MKVKVQIRYLPNVEDPEALSIKRFYDWLSIARGYRKPEKVEKTVLDREPENYRNFILEFLSNPNICSRFNIVRHTVISSLCQKVLQQH